MKSELDVIWALAVLSLMATACGGRVLDMKSSPEPGDHAGGATGSAGGAGNRDGVGSGGATGSGGSSVTSGGTVGVGGVRVGRAGAGGRSDVNVDAGSAGTRATAGTGGGGVAGAGGDAAADYVCSQRPAIDPGGKAPFGASCCAGLGTCADPAKLTSDASKSFGHDVCAPELVCAPGSLTEPIACTTHVGTRLGAGLEGRCVAKCFLLGYPLAPLLDDGGTCPNGNACAPCYSPADGKPTGACSTGADKPALPAPPPNAACPLADDAGRNAAGGSCVPPDVLAVLGDRASALYNPMIATLKQDSCFAGEKCVPAVKAANPGYCAQHCRTATQLSQLDPLFVNGACVPEFVVYDATGSAGVQIFSGPGASFCQPGTLCYSCANPLSPGTPTGACY